MTACTAKSSACWLDPHARFTVVPGMCSGQPAASAAALILAASQAGAFPFNSGSADSAIIVTLAPGTYSAQVTGTAGTALVEVYELP